MSGSPSTTSLLLLVVLSLLSLALHAEANVLRSLAEHSGSHADAVGEVKSKSHEAKVEGPLTTSYTGPLIAGALAIVLIGAVIKFRARLSAGN
jgi:hypothetical protein